ncbi:MAG: response regulator [Spirochaetaceae bacterium]
MDTKKTLLYILIFFLLADLFADTAPKEINFESYGADEGLSNLVVYDIVQDSKGFIWLGTGNGISRFDGYDFVNYLPDEDSPNSIGSGPAVDVFIDSSDRLWIAVVNGGLFLYNEESDNFLPYINDPDNENSLSSNSTYSITEDLDGNIWVSTIDKGINRLDEKTGNFTHFRHDPDDINSLSTDRIGAILIDNDNVLWITTFIGILNRYDIQNSNYTVDLTDMTQSVSITETSNGDIWMPTIGNGIYRYNKSSENYSHFNYDENDTGSISHKSAIRVIEDNEGTIWVSTWGGGLNIYNSENNKFNSYKKKIGNSKSISSNDVWGLFEDSTGVLWAGTYGAGLNRYDSKDERFSFIKNNPEDINSLSDDDVKSVFEDSFGELWIGTANGGLNRYNPEDDKYTIYTSNQNNPKSISNNSITMIAEDQERNIWIATVSGLNRYNRKTDDFTRFFSEKIIRSVMVDSKNNVWIGTQLSGVIRYSYDTKLFIHYPVKEAFSSPIFEDSSQNIWHGSIRGMFKYNSNNDSFTQTLEDPENPGSYLGLLITDIKEDQNNNLWIGTSTKLIKKEISTGKLTFYTTKNGLVDDSISGLVLEDNGNLWISTSRGLSVYSEYADSFKNYDINPFNRSSTLKTNSGELFFGSFNGLVHFYPDSIKENEVLPPVVITSFKIFNKEVTSLGSTSNLDFIELEYDDNFFSFEFAALDYSNPSKNKYKYKLEGFDKDWIEVSSKRRYASYTHLDGGDYIFRVIASNSDGIWNEIGHSIKIHIIPLFRDTLLFRILITIACWALAIIILFYIYKLNDALKNQKKSEADILHLKKYQAEVLDSMPSLIAGIDKTGVVTLWNRTAVEKTSISSEDAKGNILDVLLPDFNLDMNRIIESIQTGDIISDLNIKVEMDDDLFVDITIYPLQESDKEGAVIRIDDVTKKHKLMDELNQSSKMDAIGQLAGGMAHDFNNMLTGILNAVHLLKNPKRKIDKHGLTLVDMIMKASVRAADLISKLLAFSRKGELNYSILNIHEIIDETVEIFNRTIDKKIRIIVNKQSKYFNIIGDSSGLQNILLNLGINSSHAMPDGGEIKITTKDIILDENYCNASQFDITPGMYCDIEIQDTGFGIPAEKITKIFDPFYTTKKLGEGTGLGLSVVYGTIKDHHGVINAYSEEGTGTSFHIKLPCSESDIYLAENEQHIILGHGTILLVDDEELIRVTGKAMLEDLGYTIITAMDGEEALEVYKLNIDIIDVIIMDMIMPKVSGQEAFFKIKKIDKDCKIIISSGFTKDDNIKEMKDAGLSGFIQKPYQISELSQLLADLFR